MSELPFVGVDFTSPPPVPQAGIDRANELLASGRLFRYGETSAGEHDVAQLESAFAAFVGRRYCVAFNSCGASLAAAVMAVGVHPGEPVLMNAWTLAPVPGAIVHAGARPILVGTTADLVIDLDDLANAAAESGSRRLLLSHMRGHIVDMKQLAALCGELGITVIEDCAHTMGSTWAGRPTGTFGSIGCFSTQTFKHVNSGEGGLLVTDDEEIAARAILMSGSYMLYGQHGAAPPPDVIERHAATTPNLSMRMSALAAALALPQLALLEERSATWNARYQRLAAELGEVTGIALPHRPPDEGYVGSSIQFSVSGLDEEQMARWLKVAEEHGVHVKWFGRAEARGFTSRFDHWEFAGRRPLTATRRVLRDLCDLRIPLTLTVRDCDDIVAVVGGAIAEVR